MAGATATLLLPAARRLGARPLSAPVARALGRADVATGLEAGRRAQLLRHARLVPAHWPVAALTRQSDVGDAAGASWLRADPCRVMADLSGVRLLAMGDALALGPEDARQLLPALRPVFGDAGMPIDAPVPHRWYLRLAPDAAPPAFASPDDALGADLFEHLVEGSEGRRWRSLLSEAQVVLHNHPWNARRAEAGLPPVNSLWFWGGGTLPDHVSSPHARVHSEEEVCTAIARVAGVHATLPSRFETGGTDAVFDLVALREQAQLERDWLMPALEALADGRLSALVLDSEDGARAEFRRGQRWRLWRRPRGALVDG